MAFSIYHAECICYALTNNGTMRVKKRHLDEFSLFNYTSRLNLGLSLGKHLKSAHKMIKSLDVPLTLQSAYQTTVNNLITKLKYFDTVMKGGNL